jgi:hypothetical protein
MFLLIVLAVKPSIITNETLLVSSHHNDRHNVLAHGDVVVKAATAFGRIGRIQPVAFLMAYSGLPQQASLK